MSLPGITNDERDFPRTVRDSVTILPFRNGGEVQLGVTDVDETLVLVSALRRFENDTNIATGAHTGGNNEAVLADSAGDFINKGVEVGDTVFNDTDGSQAIVTAVTATTVTGILSGGTDDDWDTSDAYSIDKTVSHQNSRAIEIRRLRITTDLDIYLRYDGDASSGQHDIRINAGESINEDSLRVVSRISFINVTNPEVPTVRFSVFGL